MKAGCLIYYYGQYDRLGEVASRSFKKHHPDVRSTGGDTSNYDPDVEKFRDVVEAY